MNIEQIAVGIKDANGLDISDEAAITLLRHALSKLAEQDVEPVGHVAHDYGQGYFGALDENLPVGTKLYTEASLIAAQQRTAEACAKTCDEGVEKLLHFLEQNGAAKCSEAIRFEKKWMEYL